MGVQIRWVNPAVLRWARERFNLTPEQVAEASKQLASRYYEPISPEELVQWEEGVGEEPSLAHLETLAEIYVCPVGWFFLDAPPEKEQSFSLRGGVKEIRTLSARTLTSLERFLELTRWTVHLIQQSGHAWEVRIRPQEIFPNIAEAEKWAQEYRQRLGWTDTVRQELAFDPRKAFRWWRRTIEDLGIFCFELPLDPQEVRGASLWHEGIPFILVNHEDAEAASGRIFTLLHELAHLISTGETFVCDFHETSRNDEPFANRFAARVLLSPQELRNSLEQQMGSAEPRDQWSDSLLDKVRKSFFVSRDVVAILLEEMRLAPPGFYEQKREQWKAGKRWGRGGRRPTQNEQKLQEVGYSMSRLLNSVAQRQNFEWMDAALILGMKVEKLEKWLQWTREVAK
jgi:Zn-dependent peptidase ImmA (M78 family)